MPQQAAIFRLRPAHFAPPLVAKPNAQASSPILANGDASSTGTPPTLGTGVSVSGGHFTCSSAGAIVAWSSVLTVGHSYKITLDYNCSSGGKLRINNSATDGTDIKDIQSVVADSTTRTLTFLVFVADGTDFSIGADSAFYSGWIDNVVATEIASDTAILPDDDFTRIKPSNQSFGSGCVQSPGALNCSGAASIVTWTGVLTIGQQYSVTVGYNCSSGNNLRASNSATDGTNPVDVEPLTVDSTPHTLTFATFTATNTDFTLGADTSVYDGTITSGAATLAGGSVTGSVASTEADDTTSATGNVDASGTGATTEAADTSNGSGAVTIAAAEAATETNDTASASGSVTVSGTQAATEAADTTSASGSVVVSGTGSATEANDNASAVGIVGTVTGTASSTESADTASGTGSVSVAGSAASTEANDICSASGTVGSVGVIGTVASTEAADTPAASGSVSISGSTQSVELADSVSATGTLSLIGSALILEAAAAVSGTGAVIVAGTIVANDNPDTGAATGEVTAPPRQYPLVGVVQPYPGQPQTYDALPAQPYPIRSAQTYPLEGESQDYPLRGTG